MTCNLQLCSDSCHCTSYAQQTEVLHLYQWFNMAFLRQSLPQYQCNIYQHRMGNTCVQPIYHLESQTPLLGIGSSAQFIFLSEITPRYLTELESATPCPLKDGDCVMRVLNYNSYRIELFNHFYLFSQIYFTIVILTATPAIMHNKKIQIHIYFVYSHFLLFNIRNKNSFHFPHFALLNLNFQVHRTQQPPTYINTTMSIEMTALYRRERHTCRHQTLVQTYVHKLLFSAKTHHFLQPFSSTTKSIRFFIVSEKPTHPPHPLPETFFFVVGYFFFFSLVFYFLQH